MYEIQLIYNIMRPKRDTETEKSPSISKYTAI